MNPNAKPPMPQRPKIIAGVALTAAYLLGLISMVFISLGLGLFLWLISTLGGMLFLYYYRQKERQLEEERKRERADAED